ncbi:hypothetical protein CEXT_644901, partial [Caerostris extrusa]
ENDQDTVTVKTEQDMLAETIIGCSWVLYKNLSSKEELVLISFTSERTFERIAVKNDKDTVTVKTEQDKLHPKLLLVAVGYFTKSFSSKEELILVYFTSDRTFESEILSGYSYSENRTRHVTRNYYWLQLGTLRNLSSEEELILLRLRERSRGKKNAKWKELFEKK